MQERRPRADQKEGGETRRQRQPRAAQEGNHEGGQAWETNSLGDGSGSQEQPRREITKGDMPGYMGYKAAAKSSPEEIMKEDKLGTQRSSGGQEQPRMEMKRGKLGRQGGGGSQEQPRREITKGDMPGYMGYKAAAKSSPEEIMKGDKLGTQRSSGGQEQPRMEMKRGKLGRQGGSGSQEQPRREIMKGDKLGKQGRRDRQYFFLRFPCSLAFAHPPWPQVKHILLCIPHERGCMECGSFATMKWTQMDL